MPQSTVWPTVRDVFTSDKKFRAHARRYRPVALWRAVRFAAHSFGIYCTTHKLFCVVLGSKPPSERHNWLSFGKFQDIDALLSPCPRPVSSRPPLALQPSQSPWYLLPKQSRRDSLPADGFSLLCVFWLLRCRARKFQRDLRITLYRGTLENGRIVLHSKLVLSIFKIVLKTIEFRKLFAGHVILCYFYLKGKCFYNCLATSARDERRNA
jgi:hypothetical protein